MISAQKIKYFSHFRIFVIRIQIIFFIQIWIQYNIFFVVVNVLVDVANLFYISFFFSSFNEIENVENVFLTMSWQTSIVYFKIVDIFDFYFTIFWFIDCKWKIEWSKHVDNYVFLLFVQFLSCLIDSFSEQYTTLICRSFILYSFLNVLFVILFRKRRNSCFEKFVDCNIKSLNVIRTIWKHKKKCDIQILESLFNCRNFLIWKNIENEKTKKFILNEKENDVFVHLFQSITHNFLIAINFFVEYNFNVWMIFFHFVSDSNVFFVLFIFENE